MKFEGSRAQKEEHVESCLKDLVKKLVTLE